LIFLWIYGGFIAYLLAWFVAVVNMIALRREKRSGGQSPRRPAPVARLAATGHHGIPHASGTAPPCTSR
jgi:hypothetical protein